MPDHAALRRTGRAGGVVDVRDRVRVDLGVGEAQRRGALPLLQALGLLAREHEALAQRGRLWVELGDPLRGGLVADDQHRAGVAQHVREVMLAGVGVERDEHAAARDGREPGDHELGHVAGHRGDHLAGFRHLVQIAGEALGALEQLAARDRQTVLEDHRRALGVGASGARDELDDRRRDLRELVLGELAHAFRSERRESNSLPISLARFG